MDFVGLRKTLRSYVAVLKDAGTHRELPEICKEVGLPHPPAEGTKFEKITHSFDALPNADLPRLAEHLLVRFPPSSENRNKIQDLLWESVAAPEIPKRSRREVARALSIKDICVDQEKFDCLLDLCLLFIHPGAPNLISLRSAGTIPA